jgi:hypothetical protein
MAANKYLTLVANKWKEVFGTVVSAGVADANKIVALDAAGKLDISLMPAGVSAEVVVAITSENLVAGEFVNLYSNAGVLTLRKADSTTSGKPAHGFVIAGTVSPASATMYILGVNNAFMSGLTVGAKYVLSKAVPGGVTEISVYAGAAGNIVQELGVATSATNILTNPNQNYVEVA